MPEIGIGFGRSFRTYKDIKPVDKTSAFEDIYQAGVNFGTGVVDENTFTLGALAVTMRKLSAASNCK